MGLFLTWLPTAGFTVLLIVLAIWAANCSGRVARQLSAALLLEQLLTLGFRLAFGRTQTAMFLVDLLFLVALLWISSRTQRRWPVLLVTLQMLTVLGRLARLLDPTIWPLASDIMVNWTAWPSAIALTMGIWLDRKPATTT